MLKKLTWDNIREIGRSFTGRGVSPFLKTADTFAVCQSDGVVPVSSENVT